MVKISVITPTVREEGLEIVRKALKSQSFQSFEWLIGSKFDPEIPEAKWIKDDFEGGFWTLGRIYNKLLKECQGELIISLQDFTYSKFDTLERFWFHYINEPNSLVTAVGNKYTSVLPELGAIVWKDPRERVDFGSYYEVNFNDIEWNLCSCSHQALLDVGGFDEKLDFMGYGLDGYSVCERIAILGKYRFKVDQTIKSYSLIHPRYKDWDEHNFVKKDMSFTEEYLKHREKYMENPNVGFLERR